MHLTLWLSLKDTSQDPPGQPQESRAVFPRGPLVVTAGAARSAGNRLVSKAETAQMAQPHSCFGRIHPHHLSDLLDAWPPSDACCTSLPAASEFSPSALP